MIPGMNNLAAVPLPWLNSLIGAADGAIKAFLKRDIECQAYVEYYCGSGHPDLVIKQFPILNAQTQIAPASNGLALPQSTIFVNSVKGFDPGTNGNPAATPPSASINLGPQVCTNFQYTSVQPNPGNPTAPPAFLGCTGGIGTLATGYVVGCPLVLYDPNGYYGQSMNGFAPNTQLFQGSQWVTVLDSGGKKSHRGLLKRIGGAGGGWVGYYPENFYSGKLSAYRLPSWPRGEGNIKVCYSAGYTPYEVPLEIRQACAMLVAEMVRVMPNGMNMQSENLGAYSYSVLVNSDNPDLGDARRSLSTHREFSLGL
jgi:hypothetical protein